MRLAAVDRSDGTEAAELDIRVSVGKQLLKVRLKPGAYLRSGLQSIGPTAVVVVPRGAGVAGAVALATGVVLCIS